MIRKAKLSDIDEIEQSYIELLKYEEEHGSNSNWKLNVYPTREVAVNGFNNDTLYVLIDNDEVCASMILNNVQPDYYKKIKWKYPAASEEVLVIHTLCIPPSKAGHGYGKKINVIRTNFY